MSFVKNLITETTLNEEQLQAVRHGEGPLLIIAGAGTGKTTVIVERIKHLITSEIAKPDEILALTFTEKASQEMEERVDRALPYGTSQMWISTFHAFCDRVLRRDAVHIGLSADFRLMTEAETVLFFRKHLYDFDLNYFRPLGNPNKFVSGIIQHFSRLKDEDVIPSQYLAWVLSKFGAFANARASGESKSFKIKPNDKISEEELDELEKFKELASAYEKYETFKTKEALFDYADLITNTLRLFRERKSVLARYQKQFRFILIDEFQDTNFAQNELAVFLAGKDQNITVVGDDDQAIYRFRGAAVSNIIQFRNRFPNTRVVVLTKNYRSTREILDRSYDLIQHNNPDRLEVTEGIDKKLESMRRKKGEPIEFIYSDRVEQEADEVVKRIRKHVSVEAKPREGYQYKDISILVRANAHAEPFARALSRAGIPYQFLGPGQLFRQPEVKDLIAYLRVLAGFDDSVSMYRVLSMDWLGIPARDVAAIVNYAKSHSTTLFEACEQIAAVGVDDASTLTPAPSHNLFLSPKSLDKLKNLVRMMHQHMKRIKKDTAGQILYYFLTDTGLLKQFTTYNSAIDEKRAENVSKFFARLKQFESEREDASVFAVVEWIDLVMNMGESPQAADTDWSDNNAVNILTVHSSKGLEFPVVFVTNLVAARFPSIERREQLPIPDELVKEILPQGDFHEQEERRLFYVAMTRACDFLYFTASKYYGEAKREKKISPFVAEALGEEAVSQAKQNVFSAYPGQLSLFNWQSTDTLVSGGSKQPVTYLSYSQLESFITCPLQYKYRYIIKIPVPPTASLSFGDTMHRTIRAFFEAAIAGRPMNREELVSSLDKYWSPVGYGSRERERKYKEQGKEILRSFFDKGYDPEYLPEALELPFRIKITPTLKLGGKIDRVDRLKDGSVEIIDYKTGEASKTKKADDDMQLSVYALAACDPGVLNLKPEQVTVSFYFFKSQEKVSSSRTHKQLDALKEKINSVTMSISTSDFRPTPGKHCDFCEFKMICEAWQ